MLTHLSHDVSSWLSGSEIVLPTLPASGQAGLHYHSQIAPPKNIQAVADENWKISQIICTVLSQTLWLAQLVRIMHYLQTAVTDIGH